MESSLQNKVAESEVTGRQMDKKAVVHIHNGILLSYLKEFVWERM